MGCLDVALSSTRQLVSRERTVSAAVFALSGVSPLSRRGLSPWVVTFLPADGVVFPRLPPDLAPVVLGQLPPTNPLAGRPRPGLPAFELLPAGWPPACPPLLPPPLLIGHVEVGSPSPTETASARYASKAIAVIQSKTSQSESNDCDRCTLASWWSAGSACADPPRRATRAFKRHRFIGNEFHNRRPSNRPK